VNRTMFITVTGGVPLVLLAGLLWLPDSAPPAAVEVPRPSAITPVPVGADPFERMIEVLGRGGPPEETAAAI